MSELEMQTKIDALELIIKEQRELLSKITAEKIKNEYYNREFEELMSAFLRLDEYSRSNFDSFKHKASVFLRTFKR